MARCDWACNFSAGGRGVEVPYFRRLLSGFPGPLADFGVSGNDGCISTPKIYDGPAICFDSDDKIAIQEHVKDRIKMEVWDFTDSHSHVCSAYAEKFEVGISISTIEHIGLNIYGNSVEDGADLMALKNIFGVIRHGGYLAISVPASAVDFVHSCGWLRSYSIDTLKGWASELYHCYKIDSELFEFMDGNWYSVDAISDMVKHECDIDGIAIVRYYK